MVHICLVRPMNGTVGNATIGELHYTHRAVHGSKTIGIKTAENKLLLDALEREFPEVFAEPINLIVKGRDQFRITYSMNHFSLLVARFTHCLNWNCKNCGHRLKPWLIVAALFHHLLHMVGQYFSLPKKGELASKCVSTTVR